MDAFKKIGVFFVGIVIIGIVVYVISISANNPTANLTSKERIIPQRNGEMPETIKESRERGKSEQPSSKPDQDQISSDTIAWRKAPQKKSQQQTEMTEPVVTDRMPLNGNPNSTFITAAKKILPAVVSVRSSRRISHPSVKFFPPFLWPDDEEEQDEDKDRDFYQPGSGSGIIISEDGYIVTNYHVVEKAEQLRVMLYDKREFDAKLIGGDPTTDVALVKIDQDSLPAAFMGDSDSLEIGEWVMAIGNPLNFSSTVTTGIVSALGRNIDIIDPQYRYRIENFIQTDAVINPGNSGGALVNLQGEVIGINTAIATRNGFYQGYGFAIPINLAQKVVDDILKYGRVRRALLGVSIESVNDRIAKGVGLDKPIGALVQDVEPGFPAEEVGLQQGDIILAVDGEDVVSVNDLQIKVAAHEPGETVTLTVWRDRKKWEVDVELAEAPVRQPTAANESTNDDNNSLSYEHLGLSLKELSEEERMTFDVETGLLIEDVSAGSPAHRAGIFPTVILLSINGEPVGTIAEFEKIVDAAESGSILKFKMKGISGQANINGRIYFVEVP